MSVDGPELRFDLLGPLRVRIGAVVHPVTAGKQRAVPGMLLARANERVPIDELVNAGVGRFAAAGRAGHRAQYVSHGSERR